jgi:hypothetical protein
MLGGITTVPAGRALGLTVLKPDGTTLTSATTASGNTFSLANLPATGTYTLFVDPQYGSTATFTIVMNTSSNTTVAMDGASGNLSTTTTPGASGYFNFSATAGDNIGLGISNLVRTNGYSSFTYVNLYVYKPDGTAWGSYINCYTGGCDLNLGNAPATGVYSVLLVSPNPSMEPALVMSYTATVSHDAVTALTAGTAVNANLSRNGQNGRFTFSGTAGTTVKLIISGISTTPAGRLLGLTVYKPDGSTLASTSNASSYTFTLTIIPATGTYLLFVDPQYGATATLQVTQQ